MIDFFFDSVGEAKMQNGKVIKLLSSITTRNREVFFCGKVVRFKMALYFCTHKNGNTPRL